MRDNIEIDPLSYLHGQLNPSHVLASRGVMSGYMSPPEQAGLVTGMVSECDCHPPPRAEPEPGMETGLCLVLACLHTPSCPTKLVRSGDDMEPLTPTNERHRMKYLLQSQLKVQFLSLSLKSQSKSPFPRKASGNPNNNQNKIQEVLGMTLLS